MNKQLCRISNALGEALIVQLGNEMYNHNLYLANANFFALEGLIDLENYYRKRAHEEYVHFTWIYDYLCECDFKVIVPVVKAITQSSDDIIKIFEDTVEAEIKTSNDIDSIYFKAIEEKDTHTKIWLESKLIPEQHEEETTSRTALDIISLEDTSILEKAKSIYSLLK